MLKYNVDKYGGVISMSVEELAFFELEGMDRRISKLEIGDRLELLSLPDIDFEVYTIAEIERIDKNLWYFSDYNNVCGLEDINIEQVIKEINSNENYELREGTNTITIIIREDITFDKVNSLWNEVRNDFIGYASAIKQNRLYNKVEKRITNYLPVYERAKNKIILELDSYSREVSKNECNIIEVIGRTKNIESLEEKVYRKNILSSQVFERFDDIAGVRVVCEYISDVYKLLEYIKNNPLIRVIDIEDKIKNPTKEGYRGIHVIVVVDVFYQGKLNENIKVEIQLRTSFQNAWAMKTHHLTYKKEDISEIALNEMKQLGDYLYDADKKAQELRDIII